MHHHDKGVTPSHCGHGSKTIQNEGGKRFTM
jgi:hypothetical protein